MIRCSSNTVNTGEAISSRVCRLPDFFVSKSSCTCPPSGFPFVVLFSPQSRGPGLVVLWLAHLPKDPVSRARGHSRIEVVAPTDLHEHQDNLQQPPPPPTSPACSEEIRLVVAEASIPAALFHGHADSYSIRPLHPYIPYSPIPPSPASNELSFKSEEHPVKAHQGSWRPFLLSLSLGDAIASQAPNSWSSGPSSAFRVGVSGSPLYVSLFFLFPCA